MLSLSTIKSYQKSIDTVRRRMRSTVVIYLPSPGHVKSKQPVDYCHPPVRIPRPRFLARCLSLSKLCRKRMSWTIYMPSKRIAVLLLKLGLARQKQTKVIIMLWSRYFKIQKHNTVSTKCWCFHSCTPTHLQASKIQVPSIRIVATGHPRSKPKR